MNTVLYDSPLVPPEWIAAHGLSPQRLVSVAEPGVPHPGTGVGVCPFAQRFLDTAGAPGLVAVVFASACDQMRRAADVAGDGSPVPVFLFNTPATWQSAIARELYRSELERLGRFLVKVGGRAPSPSHLIEILRRYAGARALLRQARPQMSPRLFSETLARFDPETILARWSLPSVVASAADRPETKPAAPVALVGGPLLSSHYDLFDVVEAAGGTIALDATRSGEAALAPALDEELLAHDPIGALVAAYFEGVPEVSRRPNAPFHQWLKTLVDERAVRGVLLWHYVWCDIWHAEEARLREVTGRPVLRLEVGEETGLLPHTINRVQSFLEMLR